jgi:hypothetical protein
MSLHIDTTIGTITRYFACARNIVENAFEGMLLLTVMLCSTGRLILVEQFMHGSCAAATGVVIFYASCMNLVALLQACC